VTSLILSFRNILSFCQRQWLILVIPATWEAEIKGSWFEASPGKKLARPYLNKKLGVVVHIYNPSCG
jgi:hypothetical protein